MYYRDKSSEIHFSFIIPGSVQDPKSHLDINLSGSVSHLEVKFHNGGWKNSIDDSYLFIFKLNVDERTKKQMCIF